jgi:cation transport ATPase
MHDAKPFWLVSMLRTVIIAFTAYVIAVFLELVLIRVAQMPHGPLWVSDFVTPFQFIMTTAVVVVLGIPYFMKEWDEGLRSFSMFSATFLIAIAVFSATGAYDPNAPLRYVTAHVFAPMERKLGM